MNKRILVSVLGFLGIILATVGVTYAFFSYSRTGTKTYKITSGQITFLYTEASQGITLTDAMPMTDVQGKAQTGENNVFDFRVTSKAGTNLRIPYTIAIKPSATTISGDYIKLYLTDQSNNEIEGVRTLSSLSPYTNTITGLTGEKVLYEGEVPAGNTNYNKLFRLRMWIADNIDMSPVTHYYCSGEEVEYASQAYIACESANLTSTTTYPNTNASFSVKVNVYATGTQTNQTEAELRANTSIEELTVSGDDVTVDDQTHFSSTVVVPSGTESTEVPIVVDTVNDNATVKVERINSQSLNYEESKVKKVAVTKNVTVYPGTNNFKITVTPQDKSDPTIYYLTINVTSNYSITYNLDGGTNPVDAKVSYTSTSQTYNLPTPEKSGFWFEGWYENAEFTGTKVTQIVTGTTGNKTYYAKWKEKYFETDEWSTIVANVQAGNVQRYAPVSGGSSNQAVRTITMNLGDGNKTYNLRVANITPCTNGETSETACGFVLEFADIIGKKKISNNSTNAGGYPATLIPGYLMNTVLPALESALPSVVSNAIITTTVVSGYGKNDGSCDKTLTTRDDNCNYVTAGQKLYLLSGKEVFGSDSDDTASSTTRRLDYYSNNDSNKYYNNRIASWLFRSPHKSSNDRFRAKYLGSGFGLYGLNESAEISPAFRIGPMGTPTNN